LAITASSTNRFSSNLNCMSGINCQQIKINFKMAAKMTVKMAAQNFDWL